MKLTMARTNCMMLFDDGRIHFPYTRFLTNEADNPHTRALIGQSLRIFTRFLTAHRIELAMRAIEGRCLTLQECKDLAGLCYRPLPEIESMTDKQIVLVTSAVATRTPDARKNAVRPNTVKRHLDHIAAFLDHYRMGLLDEHIRSSSVRANLIHSYEQTRSVLGSRIGGDKQSHHHNIKSLPSRTFLAIIREICLRPERLFLTDSGKPCSTILRDRAMVLLACENMRPGSIANTFRNDFATVGEYLRVKDHRRARKKKVTTGTPVLKLGDSTSVNSASEVTLKLYPFTVDALRDYVDIERASLLTKRVKNGSEGFLFLNNKGEAVSHRSTVTRIFARLREQLLELGLLDVGQDPHAGEKKHYDFTAYVLRHSAASLFLAEKGTSEKVLGDMRLRFGWTLKSAMPGIYGARAMSDASNVDLINFYESMQAEAKALKSVKQNRIDGNP